jgi:hypothetical protein
VLKNVCIVGPVIQKSWRKESLQKKIKLIGLGFVALIAIYFFVDYNSTYKKCMREGNSSGLLKESFVESMCKMATSKN